MAVAARLSGVPCAVATDGLLALCDLCHRNGELNGVPLIAIRHEWGGGNVDEIMAACRAHELGSNAGEGSALTTQTSDLNSDLLARCDHAATGIKRSGSKTMPCRIILMSDVYYYGETLPGGGAALERSLRALIAHGGFRMVAASWKVRTMREDGFLWRLRDLGQVMPTVRCGNSVCVGVLMCNL